MARSWDEWMNWLIGQKECSPKQLLPHFVSHTATGQEFHGGHEGHGRRSPPVWPCAPQTNGMPKGHSGLNAPANRTTFCSVYCFFCYIDTSVFCWVHIFNHLTLMVEKSPSILVYFMFFIIGKAFAENSRSTSLQRVAARRVVSLSSCYFLLLRFMWLNKLSVNTIIISLQIVYSTYYISEKYSSHWTKILF